MTAQSQTEVVRVVRRTIVLAAAVLALVASGCHVGDAPPVQAKSGDIDLRDENLGRPIALAGTWMARAARADETGDPRDYDGDGGWRPVHVPGYFEEQGFPDDGSVWYRLNLRLPPTSYPLKGFVQHANNAHAVYVARPGRPPRLVATSGRASSAGSAAILSRAPATFSIPNEGSLVILWKVANFDYLHGGPFHAIQIGSAEAIDRMLLRKVASVFATFGIFLLVGVGFFLYWWVHRSKVETLAMALLSIAMAVRAPVLAGALEHLLPTFTNFEVRILLEAVTFLLVPGLVAMLLWQFFPLEMQPIRLGRWTRLTGAAPPPESASGSDLDAATRPVLQSWRVFNTALLLGTIGASTVLTFVGALAPPGTTSEIMGLARWLYVGLAGGAVVLLGQVLYRRRPMAVSVALGTLLLMIAGVHDILLASGSISGSQYLISYGFLGFVLAQSYALVRRYSLEAEHNRQDSEALREEVSLRTKELRAATIAAHAANMAKSQFLSAVSHELRSPLASILGYNRILKEELDEALEPQHREFFETIRASGERLTGLVNDILDAARIEAGMINLTLKPVDVRHLAADVVGQMYPLSREKGLSVRTEFGDTDTVVLADSVRLRQILINLVSNSLKFTGEGEIVISARPTTLAGNRACAISVTDTGPGISPDFIPHLFDRFTQEERLYNETQRGTGLGLSISRELVSRMNGTIGVESTLYAGSTFTIVLPSAELGIPRRTPQNQTRISLPVESPGP